MARSIGPAVQEKHKADDKADHEKGPYKYECFDADHSRNLPSNIQPVKCRLAPITVQVSAITNRLGNEIGNWAKP